MGNSEMGSPLLQDRLAIGSHASEEGVVQWTESSQDGFVCGSQWRVWSLVSLTVFMTMCCISAVLLTSSSQIYGGEGSLLAGGDGDTESEFDFFSNQRTAFHFQPDQNFMSDPCAPMYFNGYYHLFYQWNPYDRVWGNISWGHTVSTDLIHWQYLDPSLFADQWYDDQGAWSGYATIVDGMPVILYTGGRGAYGGDANQSISMAVPVDPLDPLLRQWKKVDNNPILYTPEGFSSQAFRDPTTAWKDEDDLSLWRMSVPSVIQNDDKSRDGVGLMYTSRDFYNWNLEGTFLHRVHGTGTWECLDLFPIIVESELGVNQTALNPEVYHDGMKYVLKAGMDETRVDYYAIGTYSTGTHTFTPDDPDMDVGIGHCYDYGRFYASKTFYDTSTRRRVLWGFVHELDSEDDDKIKGWASLQAIPRTVWLDGKTGRYLLQWPIVEMEDLRGAHSNYNDIELQPTDVIKVDGGDGQQLDILVAFEKPDLSGAEVPIADSEFDCKEGADKRGVFGPFGLIILADESRIEHSDIFFYITRKTDGQWNTFVCSDQSRSSLYWNLDKQVYGHYLEIVEADEELTLRVLVDHSIVETFVQGGRFAITARIYPTLAIGSNAKLFLFNNGTTPIKVKSLDVYQMGAVTMSRI
ncbi:unnamed protein product [Calypogeia fissa]